MPVTSVFSIEKRPRFMVFVVFAASCAAKESGSFVPSMERKDVSSEIFFQAKSLRVRAILIRASVPVTSRDKFSPTVNMLESV